MSTLMRDKPGQSKPTLGLSGMTLPTKTAC